MAEFLRRNVLLITSLFLLLFSFQLMSISNNNPAFARLGTQLVSAALFPLQKLHHEASESVKYLWRHYLWLLNIETERNELNDRITELEAENSRLMEFENENVRMRNLLGFV